MAEQNRQLATRSRDINDLIQSDGFKSQVELALPKFIDADRMLRIAVTVIKRNPKLQECTQDSLLSSIMTASQMGIEVDGRNGHLVPRWNSKLGCNEAQFQPDYKGIVGLVRMNDKVLDIYAELVREHDEFEIVKGLHRDLIHKIDIRKPRGKIVGAYAVILYTKDVTSFEFMDLEELYAIRERSDGWKAYTAKKISTCTWLTDEGEMCKKTVLKRLMKLADISGDTSDRLAVEYEKTMEAMPIARAVVKDSPSLPAPAKQLAAPESKSADSGEAAPEQEETSEPVQESVAASEPKKEAKRQPARQKTVEVASEVTSEPVTPSAAEHAPVTKSKAQELRDACVGYEDAQIIKVLIAFNLCEPSVTSLERVPASKIDFALTDTDTLIEELKERFPAQG